MTDLQLPEPLPLVQTWFALILPRPIEEVTAGGIILTPDSQDVQKYGQYICKILEVGPLFFSSEKLRRDGDDDLIPKVGDWIIANRMSGQRISYKDTDLRVIPDDAIIAVLPKGADGYRVGF